MPDHTGFLPFHKPSVDEREISAVTQVIQSGWLSTGSRTHAFETEFAAFLGVRHALAVSSCTAALHLALDAVGVGPGDEVLVPTLTFTATAEVVTYCGARPVLVDCEPTFHNIDPRAIENAVTPRTKAIIPVHFAGHPCDMDAIKSIAADHQLFVIEDAAHSFPAQYKGQPIGTLSDLTAFSFYATKTITTGEGGMLVTNNDELAQRISLMRLHGMTKDAWNRYGNGGAWQYDVLAPGYKYNLSDLQSAIGLVQLQKAEHMRLRRQQIATRYTDGLCDTHSVRLPSVSADVVHAWHLYPIRLQADELSINRDRFIQEMAARDIGCSVHFIPLHLFTYYQRAFGYRRGDFPVAESYFADCVSLPIYPDMTEADVQRVIAAVKDIAERYRVRHAVTPALAATA